jgi:hypothetical protein
MPVTFQFAPKVRTKNGKYEATARTLQVNLRVDLTQGGSVTQQKLGPVLEDIINGTRGALAAQGLMDAKITGDWAWVYGPWIYGELS